MVNFCFGTQSRPSGWTAFVFASTVGVVLASLFTRLAANDDQGIGATSGPQKIMPGAIWPDDRGEHVQAHGGGVIRVGDTYFWFGEQRAQGLDRSKCYVSCYSSHDLAHWTFRKNVLEQSDPENFGPRWILERPKALGKESRDIGQFIDDDGTAYLIFEERPAHGFRIAKLSADYLDVETSVAFVQAPLEGGAVVHYDGLYYAVGSHLTSWAPNPNLYATAPRLEGPWSEFKDIAPPETNTYGSQSTMLLKVVGTKSTTVIFLGDIWKPSTQWDSRYLWMPLEIGKGKLRLPEPREWTLDVETGEAAINQDAPAMPVIKRGR
jgi:hypothetical protein